MRNILLLSTCLMLAACQSKPADSYSGYVESQAVSISAPQAGWLASVNVDRGDTVTEGEALFRLDATQQQHALSGAESRATAAQASAADLAKGAREADIAPLLAQRIQAQSQLDLARAKKTDL